MKTIKNIKYLTTSEACWYVGVDEKFLNVFAKQGKLDTIEEDRTCYYEFDGLNDIKDTLAEDVGERRIAAECEIDLSIGRSLRQRESWTMWASAISVAGCVAFVIFLVFNYGLNEPQRKLRNSHVRSVDSEIPQSVKDALPDNIAINGNRAVLVGPIEIDPSEESHSAKAR